jgi:hypothetical protein
MLKREQICTVLCLFINRHQAASSLKVDPEYTYCYRFDKTERHVPNSDKYKGGLREFSSSLKDQIICLLKA